MKQSFADILQGLDDGRMRKLERKLPAWAAVDAQRRADGLDALELPTSLSFEQCSSEATARYKASVAAQAACIVDITGGLGVDSWAFSQVAERVVYYEQDAALAAAAERNFARLGVSGIEVRCETITPQTALPEAALIYADPARRNAAGRKVFLLEDCTPDVLSLLPMLLDRAPVLLFKFSPMADLAMLAGRLGPALQEIHVVEYDGEVKELLCLLRRGDGRVRPEPLIRIVRPQRPDPVRADTACGQGGMLQTAAEKPAGSLPPAGKSPAFCFRLREERSATAVFAAGLHPGDSLLVPCPALLKAGAFKLPCARWGLTKLAASTQLYTGVCPPDAPADWAPWFHVRTIREVLPFGSASFRSLRQRYPRAEITARNLPLASEGLRKKMGIAPGGDTHIFGCRLADGSAVIIVT